MESKQQEEFWAHSLQQFVNEMFDKLITQIPRKGHPTKERLKNCSEEYLINKLQEHLEVGHYSDVANFAFLLKQKRSSLSEKISDET
jgi:hypothetical protein